MERMAMLRMIPGTLMRQSPVSSRRSGPRMQRPSRFGQPLAIVDGGAIVHSENNP
jgi:hypothetical protein